MSTEDPRAAVRQYIDGFNKSDVEVMAATFAVPGAVLDGMAPHLWQGGQQPHRTGIATCGLKASNTVRQIISLLWVSRCRTTSPAMARHVVVLATMTFKVGGKQVTQSGAVFTVALRSSRRGGASRLGHGRKALLGSDMLEFDDIQHILLTAAWGRSKGTLEKQGK